MAQGVELAPISGEGDWTVEFWVLVQKKPKDRVCVGIVPAVAVNVFARIIHTCYRAARNKNVRIFQTMTCE